MIYSYDKSVLEMQHVEPIVERDRSSITEQAGYVDAETQVKRMLVAGVNLSDFRKGVFDYDDGVVPDDARPDPTLDPMFDLADASQVLVDLDAKRETFKARMDDSKVSKKEESKDDDVAET